MNLIKKYLPTVMVVASVASPVIAYAATSQKLSDVIALIAGYLNQALELLMGLAVVAFVWYVIKYFILQGDDTNRAGAAQYVMWSMIGFFIILSVWGLVNILLYTFNLGNNSPGSLTSLTNLFPQ